MELSHTVSFFRCLVALDTSMGVVEIELEIRDMIETGTYNNR